MGSYVSMLAKKEDLEVRPSCIMKFFHLIEISVDTAIVSAEYFNLQTIN